MINSKMEWNKILRVQYMVCNICDIIFYKIEVLFYISFIIF